MTSPNTPVLCGACSSKTFPFRINGVWVDRCSVCGGINSESISMEESYKIVTPYMTTKEVPADQTVYFDFMNVERTERRHGWFDPKTGMVVQVG